MVEAARKAGVRTMVWYNYRRIPVVTLAKQIIAAGKLGRIFITVRNSCRIGRSRPTCRKAVRHYGDWM